MNRKKLLSLALAGALGLSLLAGCSNQPAANTPAPDTSAPVTTPAAGGTFDLAVNFASEPETLDPTLNRTVDGSVMLNHTFEGLMKWADSGVDMKAELVPGQATNYEKTVNDDGTVTYVFTLRDGIKWSDGKDVVAGDFVYSWQRLVTPAAASPYNYMIDMVVNANEIMAGEKEPSELGVSAPDDKTLKIDLTYDCPFFEEICAFPATFPIREDIVSANPDKWTFDVATYISNGPYKMTDWTHNASIKLEKNENYYDLGTIGPDSITFKLMDDQRAILTAFKNGDLDYMQLPPVDEIPSLLADGSLQIADYLGTYYVCFQNAKAPFDDARVRKAFSLTIDRNYIVEQVTQAAELPATAFVPNGVADADPTGSDFRTTGGDYWSVDAADYEKNCEEARQLLADAGYPNGEGFPTVTYLYNTDNRHNAIAEALQQMWKNALGIEVKLDNQDWNVFLQTRTAGEYNICRNGWIADYNDPISFLDMWVTGGGNNDAHYSNEKFDAAIANAKATSVQEERMKYLHEAEQYLIKEDSALGPVFFYTQPYMLSERVEGMFYTPLGYFFFMHCTEAK